VNGRAILFRQDCLTKTYLQLFSSSIHLENIKQRPLWGENALNEGFFIQYQNIKIAQYFSFLSTPPLQE
jgi:hypothetical protein